MEQIVIQAIKVLNAGGIIIYPTETAFGIGCRIDMPESIDRLFKLRQRPLTQATPVLISSIEMAMQYFDKPPDEAKELMKKYWPGALTIISTCKKDLIYAPVRGGGNSVGLRMANHSIPLSIISEIKMPILGPSANFHGSSTPYRLEDLDSKLMKLVDLVVPGVCPIGQASTVVDCTLSPYRIIRQGALWLN